MHTQDTSSAELARFFARARYGHAANVAELVLENYGAGYAWLKPETITDPEPDDALWWPTQRGRDQVARWAAERWLFGREVS